MATKADLAMTDNMASDKKPFLTDVRETLTSIQTYINDDVKDNLVQLSKDCFPSGYAFDDDGAAQFTTHNLYDKQTAVDSYAGGDITISTTAAWTDVDATNAAITFTPDTYAGDFKATFQFSVESVTSNATNAMRVLFRLTDGSENSTAVQKIHLVTGVTATTHTIPVTLVHEFDSLSASSKTIKLQYYIETLTAVVIKVMANTTVRIAMQVEKI